jgi:hypothetical protein
MNERGVLLSEPVQHGICCALLASPCSAVNCGRGRTGWISSAHQATTLHRVGSCPLGVRQSQAEGLAASRVPHAASLWWGTHGPDTDKGGRQGPCRRHRLQATKAWCSTPVD